MDIQIINPLNIPNWDSLILRHPKATPFHSSDWARVLRDTYAFIPYYACVFKGETLSTCLPLMEVDSFLTGKRGVSLPFTDFCAPLLNGTVSSQELTDFAIAFGRDRHWKYLELRSSEFSTIPREGRGEREEGSNRMGSPEGDGRWKMEDGSNYPSFSNIPIFHHSQNGEVPAQPSQGSSSIITSCPPSPPFSQASSPPFPPFSRVPPFSPGTTPFASFSHHVLDLTPGPDQLFKGLRESTRRNIRKAEKEGVTVRFGSDLEAVKTYFRLHCLTRKRHGVPPQPWLFFENIHKNLISADKGFVALAGYQGKEIAGAVYLTFGKSALYKFGASDRSYQHLRANNSAMWAAIRHLAESGFQTLSFGRTEPENQGLIRFKSGWGAVEKSLDYFRYDYAARDFISRNRKGPANYEKFFQKLPEPALKLMGKVLYRHFGS